MKAHLFRTALAVSMVALMAARAVADPLPGEVLKFENLPLVATAAGGYPGHDEMSTISPSATQGGYTGQVMADDFADPVATGVFHVEWWGSYLQGSGANQFLITFESDVPAGPAGNFSTPGTVLSAQTVTLGALAPGSGTFTETPVPDPGSPEGNLFQYNAELTVPFAEQPNTVYWLKIAAVENPQTPAGFVWGWHDRDWSVADPLASKPPLVSPGEGPLGTVGSGLTVNHFQDDAVTSSMLLAATSLPASGPIAASLISESGFAPQHYIAGVDGPAGVPGGPPGIDSFSKDLAFALYTRPTPEPSTLALLGIGAGALAMALWCKSRAR